MKTDKRDFEYRVCRGDDFKKNIIGIRDGFKPQYEDLVSGFSDKPKACKRFARGHNKKGHIPSVVYMHQGRFYEENNPKKLCYTSEWLEKHPKIVESIQTERGYDKRDFKEKIESAKTFKEECELIVEGEAKTPDAEVNVYLSREQIDDINGETTLTGWFGGNYLEDYHKPMTKAKLKLLKIKEEVGVDNTVKIYLCHSTLNLSNDEDSRCTLWGMI